MVPEGGEGFYVGASSGLRRLRIAAGCCILLPPLSVVPEAPETLLLALLAAGVADRVLRGWDARGYRLWLYHDHARLVAPERTARRFTGYSRRRSGAVTSDCATPGSNPGDRVRLSSVSFDAVVLLRARIAGETRSLILFQDALGKVEWRRLRRCLRLVAW